MADTAGEHVAQDIDFFDDDSSDEDASVILYADQDVHVPKTRNFSHRLDTSSSVSLMPGPPGNENSTAQQKRSPPPRPPRSPQPGLDRGATTTTAAELVSYVNAGHKRTGYAEFGDEARSVGLIEARLARDDDTVAPLPSESQDDLLSTSGGDDSRIVTLQDMLVADRAEDITDTQLHAAAIDSHVDSSRQADVMDESKQLVPAPLVTHSTARFKPSIGLIRAGIPGSVHIRKSLLRQSRISLASVPNEALLLVSLRRRLGSTRAPRLRNIRIPASLDIVPTLPSSPKREQKQSEQHFEMVDFDDMRFFRALRTAHGQLAGWPRRLLSARTLSSIDIISTNPAHQPRRPLAVAASDLADTFSETNFLRFYQRPRLGKALYMWVHWAHRLASTPLHLLPAAPSPRPLPEHPLATATAEERAMPLGSTTDNDKTQSVTDDSTAVHGIKSPALSNEHATPQHKFTRIEFIHSWSIPRLTSAVLLVAGASIAAALVYIFYGPASMALVLDQQPIPQHDMPANGTTHMHRALASTDAADGYRIRFDGAPERVVAGCLLGLFGMILGSMLVALWALVSWLCD